MMRYVLASLLLLPVLLAGCESTQEKSAKLEAQGAEIAKVEKIKIGAANQAIDIVNKTILTDQYGTAVVLRLKDNSPEGQTQVPIGLVAKDDKGNVVYKNDTEGLENGLINIPLIEGNSETWWVNDQLLVTEKPKSVDVEIGTSEETFPPALPQIEVTPPVIEQDPVSGVNVTGKVINKSAIEQTDLLLYAVATKGGKVVAAGRGLIPKLKADGKPEFYRIYFIGDPTGADVEAFALPTSFE